MGMNEKIRELIAVGASITANCQPCVRYHAEKAVALGAGNCEVTEAIEIGKLVRKGAAAKMDAVAAELATAGAARSGEVVISGCGCDFAGP